MGNLLRGFFTASLAAAALATMGCTLHPIHGDPVDGTNRVAFDGFSTAPQLEMRVLARNPWNGGWTEIGRTRSSANVNTSFSTSSRPLYDWAVNVTVSPWFWSGGQATVKAQQSLNNGNWVDTYMYDRTGFNCLISRWGESQWGGVPWDPQKVGIECSGERHEVTLVR